MSEKNSLRKMHKKELKQKKEIGVRFRQFREQIGKVQSRLSAELNVSQSTIANIENGSAFPNHVYLFYLYHRYRLNVNWLLTGDGEMLRKALKKEYVELLNQMEVPAVRQQIMAKLVELKSVLKEEIRAYFEKQDQAES
ncbi:MAG: helix-turn-helix transcriptional regulator [bacterium]|nr:helix-turn-helix transcriptional regulator [bacterium]